MDKHKQRTSKSFTSTSSIGIQRALYTMCGISAPNINGSTQPKVIEYKALWDTGATGTVVSKRVAEELGLHSTGVRKVNTAGGQRDVSTYYINVNLPNDVVISFVDVTEGILEGFDVLIGMDIITQGDFAITHDKGKTKFSFQIPSTHSIDFVQEYADLRKPTQPIVKRKLPGRNDLCYCGSGKKYKKCCLIKGTV